MCTYRAPQKGRNDHETDFNNDHALAAFSFPFFFTRLKSQCFVFSSFLIYTGYAIDVLAGTDAFIS